jgi:small conductance mechanosensitive channel
MEVHMGSEIEKLQIVGEILASHGRELAIALILLIAGFYLAKYLTKYLRIGLNKVTTNLNIISIVSSSFFILFLMTVVMVATTQAGMKPQVIFSALMIAGLATIGIITLFRPYLPTLPFEVGNTVKAGDVLGKVEAITFLNTRMKTFDGLTVFIPNRQILNDVVINYHFTATRKVKVDVGIGYDQDILEAKRIMEELMITDPRVKKIPRPVVFTVAMEDSWIKLGARCWVDNPKYWLTRCDLIEKVKYRFDEENIRIAFPQLDVHHYELPDSIEFSGEEVPA